MSDSDTGAALGCAGMFCDIHSVAKLPSDTFSQDIFPLLSDM